jgi:predicted DNA-binding protein (UPF0251 family)
MEGEKILMSARQLQRLEVMGLVEAGRMKLKEAAEKIGMSYRQTKRIRKRVKEEGIKGVVHGNTGKASNHRMKEGIKAKVYQFPPLFSLMNRSVYNKGNFAPDRRIAAQRTRFSNPTMPGVNL